MEPLLEIKVNPIEIDMTYERAKLEVMSQSSPSYIMTREVGGLDISYKPGRMQMDSYEMRKSLGIKNNFDLSKSFGDSGLQNVQSYMQTANAEARRMMTFGQNGVDNNDLFKQMTLSKINANDPQFAIAFKPDKPVQFNWQPHELSMSYTPDKLDFNWQTQRTVKFKYTPASLEFSVTQYPSVEFTYLGKPNYAPPSSAPDYA